MNEPLARAASAVLTGNGGDYLADLKPVQNGGLASLQKGVQ